jgi:hypothetical protein
VGKDVRAASLLTMCGDSVDMGVDPQPELAEAHVAASDGTQASRADSASNVAELIKHVKKRRLYRQVSGTEVVWFPHDNAPALLKEFLWESNQDATRLVIHGTPSSAAGVSGLLDSGASVLAICEDQHHKKHFLCSLRERCVELLIAGSSVFADQTLSSRAELLFGKKEKKQKEMKKDKKTEKETEKEDEKKKEKRKDKPNKKRKKLQLPSSSLSSSSASSSSSSPNKKPKKR